MRISEVASRSGVPPTTLRYYENVGLLESLRTPNGYRCYDQGVLARLSLIEAGKHLGLSLPEIRELLDAVDGDTCTGVREALHPIVNQRLDDVDRRLGSLQVLRDRVAAAAVQVAACPDNGRSCRSECMVLGDRFEVGGPNPTAPVTPLSPRRARKPPVGPSGNDPGSGGSTGDQRL